MGKIRIIDKKQKRELIAKAHFWFGSTEDIFRDGLIIEHDTERALTYVFKPIP